MCKANRLCPLELYRTISETKFELATGHITMVKTAEDDMVPGSNKTVIYASKIGCM